MTAETGNHQSLVLTGDFKISEYLKGKHFATLFQPGRFKLAIHSSPPGGGLRVSVVMLPGQGSTLHLIDLDSQSRLLSFFQVLSNEATEAGLMLIME